MLLVRSTRGNILLLLRDTFGELDRSALREMWGRDMHSLWVGAQVWPLTCRATEDLHLGSICEKCRQSFHKESHCSSFAVLLANRQSVYESNQCTDGHVHIHHMLRENGVSGWQRIIVGSMRGGVRQKALPL